MKPFHYDDVGLSRCLTLLQIEPMWETRLALKDYVYPENGFLIAKTQTRFLW